MQKNKRQQECKERSPQKAAEKKIRAAETGEGAVAPATSRQCEECEKVRAEIVCEECKASYCKECCKSTHEDLGWDHAFNCSLTPITLTVQK